MQKARRWGGVVLAATALFTSAGPGFAQDGAEYQFFEIPGSGTNTPMVGLSESGTAFGRVIVSTNEFQPAVFGTTPPFILPLPLDAGFRSGGLLDLNIWGQAAGDGLPNGAAYPLRWEDYYGAPVIVGEASTPGSASVVTNDSEYYGRSRRGSNWYAAQFGEAGAGISAASRSAHAVQSGTVKEIPTITGTPWSEVNLGNDQGTIAGFAQTPDGKEQRVWIRRPGAAVRVITPFNGYPNGRAYGMNQNGDLVGLMSTSLTLFQGFYIPFYYVAEADLLVYLGLPTGHRGVALAVATVNGRTFAVGYIERVDGTARFAARWEVDVQPATAGPRVAAAPTVRITQTYFQNRMAPHASGFVPQTAISINSRGQVLVAGRTREPKTVYGLLKPTNALGSSTVHYLPRDDVAPNQRTGVWCESVQCPDGRLISRAKDDPKEVQEEGKHGKDNPLPYDPTRLYRCSCEP